MEAFIHAKRLNKTKLIEQLEISRATLYNWFGRRMLQMDTLALLKDKIGFIPGENPVDSKHTIVQSEVKQLYYQDEQLTKGNIIRVPLHAIGGFLQGYRNRVYVDMLEHYSLPGYSGEFWDFEVEGMSMYCPGDERSAKPGDRLLTIKKDGINDLSKGKGYVVQVIDGLCYKVFDKIKDDKAYFISINPESKNIDFHLKEIKGIYFVKNIIKNPY